ncbi:MAG: transporter [Clostridiales bacterium]|jgi:MFS family permease|nr:transporter [Clostridiales bacterium]
MGDYKIKIRSNIWKIYAYWFSHSLIFAYVIERLYWAGRGITVQQVVYTEIIYAATVIILEVPSGALADKWSRKNMMVINAVLHFVEFLMLIYANRFWHFALIVFLSGIGKAMSSGTSNAILYDSLKLINEEDKFEKLLGRVNFFDYSSGLIAALVGSYVAYRAGLVSVYWLSLISVGMSIVIAISIREPKIITQIDTEEVHYLGIIKNAYSFLKNEPTIRFILLLGIIIGASMVYVDEFWQIYISEIKIPVIYFGIISGIRSLSSSIFGVIAYRIKKWFSYKTIFTVTLLIYVGALVLTGYVKNIFGLIPLAAAFSVFGVIEPLVSGYLHHRTDSSCRATVESFQSLVYRGFSIILGLAFGFFSTNYSIFHGFRFLGFFSLAYFIYYFLNRRKYIME